MWYALCALMCAIVDVPGLEFLVIRGLDGFLPVGQDGVELPNRRFPTGLVQIRSERFVVLAAVGGRRLALELGQLLLVPENQVAHELGDRVVGIPILPRRLLRREALDGLPRGNEPVLNVVGRLQLLEQDGLEGGSGSTGLIESGAEKQKDQEVGVHMSPSRGLSTAQNSITAGGESNDRTDIGPGNTLRALFPSPLGGGRRVG